MVEGLAVALDLGQRRHVGLADLGVLRDALARRDHGLRVVRRRLAVDVRQAVLLRAVLARLVSQDTSRQCQDSSRHEVLQARHRSVPAGALVRKQGEPHVSVAHVRGARVHPRRHQWSAGER